MTSQKIKKIQGNLFVLLIICLIGFVYFCNAKLIWMDRRPNTFWTYFYLVLFNLSSFMLAWSLITTILTDPGYFLDDPEHKKRRYCLICHIFKPERTHHCSACNRCVLNMDHHCPWLGNCIGFANRKFFLLLLFYVNITIWLACFGMIGEIFNIFMSIKNRLGGDESIQIQWFSDFLIVASFGLDVAAMIMIGIFFKFHIELLIMNTTTIENLDRKRTNPATPNVNSVQNAFQSIYVLIHLFKKYDMGEFYNFLQVFGSNKAYWPFPFFFGDARPAGDGVIWPQKVQTTPEIGTTQSNDPFKSTSVMTNNSSINLYNNKGNCKEYQLNYQRSFKPIAMSPQQQNPNQYNSQLGNANNAGKSIGVSPPQQMNANQVNQNAYQINNIYRNQM